MASLQHIKKRITGVQGVRKITSAMELVAATKMRKAQEVALASRPFAYTALEMLANVLEHVSNEQRTTDNKQPEISHPLLAKQEVKNSALLSDAQKSGAREAVLLVTSDKGLAGSFNSNVFRAFEKHLANNKQLTTNDLVFITVGEKANAYAKRRGYEILKRFTKYGDLIRSEEIHPLADYLAQEFTDQRFGRLTAFSTNFVSTLRQEVIVRELLPLDFARVRETVERMIPETGRYSELRKQTLESRPTRPLDYLIEPSPQVILTKLIPYLFSFELYHLMLEANASEHSARRVAMKNASDNAADLVQDLTQEYNRGRQAAITKELTEIVGTAKALGT